MTNEDGTNEGDQNEGDYAFEQRIDETYGLTVYYNAQADLCRHPQVSHFLHNIPEPEEGTISPEKKGFIMEKRHHMIYVLFGLMADPKSEQEPQQAQDTISKVKGRTDLYFAAEEDVEEIADIVKTYADDLKAGKYKPQLH